MSMLKPCPFCKSVLVSKARYPGGVTCWVECRKCGAKTREHIDDNAAVAAWNEREEDRQK